MHQPGDVFVVVRASRDGLFEDAGIRGHASKTVGDQVGKLAGARHPAIQVVEPGALSEPEQRAHCR